MAITKTVNLDVQSNLDESTKSVGSLKAQLRQAQAEVAALSDKFGATSQQAIEAAKRAGELKDRIGDAKALTDAFNPDAKFNSLSSSLAGVAGGFSGINTAPINIRFSLDTSASLTSSVFKATKSDSIAGDSTTLIASTPCNSSLSSIINSIKFI